MSTTATLEQIDELVDDLVIEPPDVSHLVTEDGMKATPSLVTCPSPLPYPRPVRPR